MCRRTAAPFSRRTASCPRLPWNRGMALPILTLVAASCGGDTTATAAAVRDTLPNGALRVRHVLAGASGPTWDLEPELRIGSVDASGPAQLGMVVGLAVHPDGRIAILDAHAQEIRVFGPDGAHLRTFGGRGGGPGEYQAANGLALGPDGLLRVPDERNTRLSFVDMEVGWVRGHPYQPLLFAPAWPGVVDSAGNSWSPHFLMGEREGEGSMAFVGYDPTGVAIDTLSRPRPVPHPLDDHPGRWAVFADGELQANLPVPSYAWERHVLTPHLRVWSTGDGDPSYRLIRWTPGAGDTTLVIEADRPPPPIDRVAADSVVHDYESRFDVSLDRSKIPDVDPVIRAFFVDDDARLWVSIHTGGDSVRTFDAFDADGGYLGTLETRLGLVTVPAPVIRGDTLWGVVRDELDVPYIARARLLKARGD
jgi:hypothetical protein